MIGILMIGEETHRRKIYEDNLIGGAHVMTEAEMGMVLL